MTKPLAIGCALVVAIACGPQPSERPVSAPMKVRVVRVPVVQTVTETKIRVKIRRKSVPSRAVPPPGNRLVRYSSTCRVVRGAAASLKFIEAILGQRIRTVSCWRSHAQQAALYRNKPHLAARPGTSLHEKGRAIDLSLAFRKRFPRVHQLLLSFGWSQFSPRGEPWHYSYRSVG